MRQYFSLPQMVVIALMLVILVVFPIVMSCSFVPGLNTQAQGIGYSSQRVTEKIRGDTTNDTSTFWAMVVNNALITLGLPLVAGLFWYKRRQMTIERHKQ